MEVESELKGPCFLCGFEVKFYMTKAQLEESNKKGIKTYGLCPHCDFKLTSMAPLGGKPFAFDQDQNSK